MSRAWAFQERLVSQRVIHFTYNEIMWECAGNTTCECEGMKSSNLSSLGFWYKEDGDLKSLFSFRIALNERRSAEEGSLRSVSIFKRRLSTLINRRQGVNWDYIVNKYTTLSLTKHKDMLPALSAIAKSFAGSSKGRYLAGLWESDLLYSLCWFARQPSRPCSTSTYSSWS